MDLTTDVGVFSGDVRLLAGAGRFLSPRQADHSKSSRLFARSSCGLAPKSFMRASSPCGR